MVGAAVAIAIAILEAIVVPSPVAAVQAATPPPRAFVVDRGTSRLWVVVHRAGLLSFLGHEHAIVPVEWRADLCLADPLPAGSHASLVVETGSLVIDSDSARALAGMGGGPGEDDRRDIQDRMLGPEFLDAARFPEIRIDLHAVASEDDRVDVEGAIEVHGVTRDVRLPVRLIHEDGDSLALTGRLRIRLRDFGIEPESRAGLVKVSNDVDLHFAIQAAASEGPCQAG